MPLFFFLVTTKCHFAQGAELENGDEVKFVQEPFHYLQEGPQSLLRSSKPQRYAPFQSFLPVSFSSTKRSGFFFFFSILNFLYFSAYNIATGNAPPVEERPPAADGRTARRKRQRDPKPPPPQPRGGNRETEEHDGPMSHQDYIDKRRQEPILVRRYQNSNLI
jgi:hypothetical protein